MRIPYICPACCLVGRASSFAAMSVAQECLNIITKIRDTWICGLPEIPKESSSFFLFFSSPHVYFRLLFSTVLAEEFCPFWTKIPNPLGVEMR